MSYNGYTNYETWAVQLWIDNDQGLYEHFRALAERIQRSARRDVDRCWTAEEAARFTLAEAIKDWLEESNPLRDSASHFSDILTTAIGRVNTSEIAENILESIQEEAA